MLEKVVKEEEVSKEECSKRLEELERILFDLQRKAKEVGIPALVIFEGFHGAGKGDAIRTLVTRLDPRTIKVHPFGPPTALDLEKPWLWRFWMRLPNKGELAVFDTSWYRHILDDRVAGPVSRREGEERFHEINELERALVDDGLVLVKLWLHISRKEQEKRLRKADKDQEDFWDVAPEEWEQNDRYKKWLEVVEEVLERTSTEWGPWTIVRCSAPRLSRIRVVEAVIGALRDRLAKVAPQALAELKSAAERAGALKAAAAKTGAGGDGTGAGARGAKKKRAEAKQGGEKRGRGGKQA
jgi:polyphosphate kinase 2 (PPK2 family)